MKVWAIIDRDSDRANDTREYRDRDVYLMFTFNACGAPIAQIWDHRHERYARESLALWQANGHQTAELVKAELTIPAVPQSPGQSDTP